MPRYLGTIGIPRQAGCCGRRESTPGRDRTCDARLSKPALYDGDAVHTEPSSTELRGPM
jgi:hypothetical protein